MNTKHTQGPWVIDGDDTAPGGLVGVYIAKKGSGRVAQTFANCLVKTDEQCRANARLIAAAPLMSDALRAAKTAMESIWNVKPYTDDG